MNRAMLAAASGMAAEQSALDTVARNLASADVTAFKQQVTTLAPLFEGDRTLGVAVTGARTLFSQGKLERSGGAFDVAIDGPGFFRVTRAGETAYTRDGSFSRRADGSLALASGWRLSGVRIPTDAVRVDVAEDGAVRIETAQRRGITVGRLRLTTFSAPEELRALDAAIFAQTQRSGPPQPIVAGGESETKIAFGQLEHSNVSIVESMMGILAAQRAYEADAKGVQAADEMERIANNLQRG